MAFVGFFGIIFVLVIIYGMFSNATHSMLNMEKRAAEKPLPPGIDGRAHPYDKDLVWSDVMNAYVDLITYEVQREDLDEDDFERDDRIIRMFGSDAEKRDHFGDDKSNW